MTAGATMHRFRLWTCCEVGSPVPQYQSHRIVRYVKGELLDAPAARVDRDRYDGVDALASGLWSTVRKPGGERHRSADRGRALERTLGIADPITHRRTDRDA